MGRVCLVRQARPAIAFEQTTRANPRNAARFILQQWLDHPSLEICQLINPDPNEQRLGSNAVSHGPACCNRRTPVTAAACFSFAALGWARRASVAAAGWVSAWGRVWPAPPG